MLTEEGFSVCAAESAEEALEKLANNAFLMVITDARLGGMSGYDLLARIHTQWPDLPALMITAYATPKLAVEAIKSGAMDYLSKPFAPEELFLAVARCAERYRLLRENAALRQRAGEAISLDQIVGESSKIRDVRQLIQTVAATDARVLVLGESGTGKELVAGAIHTLSRRNHRHYVRINCAAIPETLLESELFGHERGAFTGAIRQKSGRVEEADGGTIFLDEIASMSHVLQSRLLRVLQEKEVRRVGDNVPVSVNVRVLAATNEPLEKRLKEGTFREDLYYRLNVIPINLPALRERREDVPVLAMHFLRNKINSHTGKLYGITRKALDVLSAHDWPGNVRELENAIERACALCEEGTIRVADLPPTVRQHATGDAAEDLIETPQGPPQKSTGLSLGAATAAAPPALTQSVGPLRDFLREQELTYVNRALAQAAGDKEKAAELLGVSVATLYRKLAEEDITT
jgi:DNA-binding NtrC family response regulator